MFVVDLKEVKESFQKIYDEYLKKGYSVQDGYDKTNMMIDWIIQLHFKGTINDSIFNISIHRFLSITY